MLGAIRARRRGTKLTTILVRTPYIMLLMGVLTSPARLLRSLRTTGNRLVSTPPSLWPLTVELIVRLLALMVQICPVFSSSVLTDKTLEL